MTNFQMVRRNKMRLNRKKFNARFHGNVTSTNTMPIWAALSFDPLVRVSKFHSFEREQLGVGIRKRDKFVGEFPSRNIHFVSIF